MTLLWSSELVKRVDVIQVCCASARLPPDMSYLAEDFNS